MQILTKWQRASNADHSRDFRTTSMEREGERRNEASKVICNEVLLVQEKVSLCAGFFVCTFSLQRAKMALLRKPSRCGLYLAPLSDLFVFSERSFCKFQLKSYNLVDNRSSLRVEQFIFSPVHFHISSIFPNGISGGHNSTLNGNVTHHHFHTLKERNFDKLLRWSVAPGAPLATSLREPRRRWQPETFDCDQPEFA